MSGPYTRRVYAEKLRLCSTRAISTQGSGRAATWPKHRNDSRPPCETRIRNPRVTPSERLRGIGVTTTGDPARSTCRTSSMKGEATERDLSLEPIAVAVRARRRKAHRTMLLPPALLTPGRHDAAPPSFPRTLRRQRAGAVVARRLHATTSVAAARAISHAPGARPGRMPVAAAGVAVRRQRSGPLDRAMRGPAQRHGLVDRSLGAPSARA